ncbi:iron uptake porin [Synechococcus sp. W4D4]|uniref:iron uptake porin n=1 Tax=Synechococcus sp. W4D4 TaxID=3392294 RepID=UPI0039ECFE12
MKLFQKLVLAPAALGLLAPVAANAADVNLSGLSAYGTEEQVTSITQFSDVQPTDWAYQALSNLIERYGCVAGYPNGIFRGQRAMTRYEAAALLNACLDRITEVTDELKRLMKEFERELAILKGRVDGLEARVGELEATQFSTTTKLEGDYYWALGGVTATGGNSNSAGTGSKDWYNKNYGAMHMVYDARLNLKTSFTGKDLLYTRLRAGNFDNSPFDGKGFKLTKFDKAEATDNAVIISRLYYRFPVGKEFKFAVGPVARNTEFLGTKPFYYKGWSGLDFFQLFGAPGTYNKATGSLVGAIWKQKVKKGQPYFTASSSYVAAKPNGSDGSRGIMTSKSEASTLTQLAYNANQWKASFGWNYTQCGDDTTRSGTQAAMVDIPCNGIDGNIVDARTKGNRNGFAATLAWRPKKTGLIPSISTGWGYNAYSYSTPYTGSKPAQTGGALKSSGQPNVAGNLDVLNIQSTQSWTVGLQWDDAFVKGNTGGFAIGQPTFVTSTRNGTTPFDAGYVMEGFYKFQVSDNIAVTPVLFYMSNPSSAGAGYAQTSNQGSNLGVFGGALTTRFKF